MNISKENYQLLQEINSALSEIYTKGQDSVMIVQARQALYKVISEITEELEPLKININDIKEE